MFFSLQQNVDYSHPSNFYSSLLPTRVNAAASPSSVLGHSESCEQNHSSNGSNNTTPIPSTSSSSNNQMSFSGSNNNSSSNRNASPIVYGGGGGGGGESVNEHYKTRIGGHGIFKPIAKNASFNNSTSDGRSITGGRDNCKNIHNDSHDDRPSPGDSIVSAGADKDDQEECMSRERTLSPSDSSIHSNSPSPDLPATSSSATATAAAAAAAAAASLSSAIPVPPFPASHLLEFYSQYFNGSFKAADSLHSLAAARETGL